MLDRNPILAHLWIPQTSKARRVGSVTHDRRQVLRARCRAVRRRARAEIEEITVGARSAVIRHTVLAVVIETDTGPNRRQRQKDDNEGEDVGRQFGDVDKVLKYGE